MRLFMILLSCTALLFAAGCGSDDNNGSGDSGNALTGTITHLLYEGSPVAGAAVGSPTGAHDASGVDGKFSLSGVTAPYDIVAVAPAVGGSAVFSAVVDGTGPAVLGAVPVGYNNPAPADPVLGRSSALNQAAGFDQDGAAVSGTVSGMDAAGLPIRVAISDGQRSISTNGSAATGSYGPSTYLWLRSLTYTVSLGALQEDSGGNFRYGRTQGISLGRNSPSMANVAMNPLAGSNGSVSVSLSPPAGTTLSGTAWMAFAIIDGMSFSLGVLSADAGSITIPPAAANISILISVSTQLDDGASAGGFQGSWPGVLDGASLNIVIPAPPVISSPSTGATDLSLTPDIEFTGSPGAVATVVDLFGQEPYGELQQEWLIYSPTTTGTIAIPVSPAVSAELYPSSDYIMAVISVIESTNLNAANLLITLNGTVNPGYDLSIAQAGVRSFLVSPTTSFTTADE